MSVFFSTVLAQSIENPALGGLEGLSGAQFFNNLIPALVSLGLVIGAVVFIFYFLTGAISWISSGGDKMKIEQARSKLTTALIGLIILLCFIAIISLLEAFFGIGLRQVRVGTFRIEFSPAPTPVPTPIPT
jgi:hypothetical protein